MYNKVLIIGNLTRDPEMRYTPSGVAVTKFTVAVNRSFKKSTDANAASEVDFLRIVAWRRLAEICGEFLKKGTPVYIEGRLQLGSYEKDGEKRTTSEIIADNMQMLGRRSASDGDYESNDNGADAPT